MASTLATPSASPPLSFPLSLSLSLPGRILQHRHQVLFDAVGRGRLRSLSVVSRHRARELPHRILAKREDEEDMRSMLARS